MPRLQDGIHSAIGLVLGVCLLSQAAPNASAQFSANGRIGRAAAARGDVGDTATSRQPPSSNYNKGWSTPPAPSFNFGDLFKPQPNNNPQPRNRQRDYDDGGSYYQQPQQPRYYTPPVQPQAVVRTNAAPKAVETILPVDGNSPPDFTGLELTSRELTILRDNAKANAEKALDSLKDDLGPAAMDPAVMKELAEIQEKIDKGEAVTDQDLAELETAAKAAKDPNGNDLLPQGFDPEKAGLKAGEIRDWTDFASRLDDEANSDLLVDDGQTDVFGVSSLPEDDMVMLPDGSVAVGTGGAGGVSMVSMETADAFGVAVGVGEPVPDANGDVAARIKDGVLIMNPIENGVAIEYIVANTNYKMEPSFTQHLPPGRTWVIEFDRGEGHGTARYTLSDGTYAFGPSDKGWELFKQTLSVTLENAGNESAFNYNIDNTQCVLPAGESKSHTSFYPILVRFDRGNGKEAQKKVVARSAHYRVAVDPRDKLWELFDVNGSAPGVVAIADDIVFEGDGGLAGAPVDFAPAPLPAAAASKARATRLRELMLKDAKQE